MDEKLTIDLHHEARRSLYLWAGLTDADLYRSFCRRLAAAQAKRKKAALPKERGPDC